MFNILLRPDVDINAQREAKDIILDRGPQQTLNTENPCRNAITALFKLIWVHILFSNFYNYSIYCFVFPAPIKSQDR